MFTDKEEKEVIEHGAGEVHKKSENSFEEWIAPELVYSKVEKEELNRGAVKIGLR